MRIWALAGSLLLCAGPAAANQVEIVHAQFDKSGDRWNVGVTLRHADTGWDHYADQWRVVDAQGRVLAKRVLWHPHEDEQPFTRDLEDVKLPAGVTTVYIEAHDKVHGWSPQRVKVDLTASHGDRFDVSH